MTTDIHRPELHFTTETGVLEAPAGVLLDGESWHLFFQYKLGADEKSRWGHTYSTSLPFDWIECDDVLAPAGGETGLRAGAVAAVDGGINLYFTSITGAGSSVNLASYANVDDVCEVSDEIGALDPHVLRHGAIVQDTEGFTRFRTPCVVPDWDNGDRSEGHKGWLMLALTGEAGSSTPVILSSADGVSWTLDGELTFEGEDTGFKSSEAPGNELPPVAAPRIIRLRDEVDGEIYDVLFITLERDGAELSGYLVGRLEGTVFNVVTGFKRIDYGHDFTRPRNTNVTAGTIDADKRYEEAVIFGLMSGAGRQDAPAEHPSLSQEGWANALSLPRYLTLQGGVIYQTPARGLPDAVATTDRARLWTGLLEVPSGSEVEVQLLDGNGSPAAIIKHSGDELTLDRSLCGAYQDSYAGDAVASAPLREDDSDSLTIVVDGSTVEVYADGGQVAMASRVYFDGGCSGISASTSGEAEIVREWERHGS
ncbi:GH32 C-terminal domain-containing protein [Corynebacterium endometrii]|uniref:beta-fructofuranosidase n=1 Tax=Corynebacterium endometrii TaxID=2488819 RepID=A0A4P7QES3_9CORY|nr:GH32 C-terminal domain-containing protein [Corynebacterium endometrii]QCB28181.1 Sucrose-6-phosphate hydrolase [Corynebacterium endometrii]